MVVNKWLPLGCPYPAKALDQVTRNRLIIRERYFPVGWSVSIISGSVKVDRKLRGPYLILIEI